MDKSPHKFQISINGMTIKLATKIYCTKDNKVNNTTNTYGFLKYMADDDDYINSESNF